MEEPIKEYSHYHDSNTSRKSVLREEDEDHHLLDIDGVESDNEDVRKGKSCHELAIEGEALSKQGEYGESIPVLEAALESGTDDLQLTSVLWSLLGNAHFYQGDYDTAVICHSHDLSICCESSDEKSKAQAYCNLGIAYRKSGYLQKAKLCYESYLELCELLEDRRSISKANHNLGDLHFTLGRLKLQRDGGIENSPDGRDHLSMASMYFEKHLEYIQDQGSKASECRAHGNLGMIYELLKNTDKAIDHHQKRLDIALEIGDKGNIGRSYCSIGNCLRAILQPDKAMECYKRGLGVATELDDQTGIGVCHCNMGSTLEMLGNIEQTAEEYEKQLKAMKNSSNIHGQVLALASMAKVYESLANATKAIEALQKLVYLHRELKDETQIKEALEDIARLGGSEIEATTSNSLSNGAAVSLSNISGMPSKGEKTEGGGKKGGIFKKLKEKRAKKRSVIVPETTMSVSGVLGTDESWRSTSPIIKESKKSDKKAASKEKLNMVKLIEEGSSQSRSESVSSREEKESSTAREDLNDRKRAWSHGNINKVSFDGEQNEMSHSLSHSKLSHSGSVTFSPVEHLISDPGGTPFQTDGYVINGPSPGETFEHFKVRKTLYDTFGSKSHRETLKELEEFLNTAGETEAVDLSSLQDWDGWMIGSRDIIIQSTKESKLI